MYKIGKNIEMKLENNKLIITVDLSVNLGPSKSGKTQMIASSEGNQPVPEKSGMFVGLNIYRK